MEVLASIGEDVFRFFVSPIFGFPECNVGVFRGADVKVSCVNCYLLEIKRMV